MKIKKYSIRLEKYLFYCDRFVTNVLLKYACLRILGSIVRLKEIPMNLKSSLLKGLDEDQLIKVRDCENVRDLLQLVEDEGVELNEEQLRAVSGGGCGNENKPVKTR